ncbi:hypothetical protein MtrunA17_Chr7g0270611 [Medicago truncatula]|uniref:Uncharacterized protein n=1 Tax=Medicago truncatula TaxID=3880 RepID=A4PU35_MEDTR|nr:hypothetical protein MtrDRAFT_AC144563g16v2 [Medicago truncatula]RHN49077.1 hypothetical protein MtrunA17_Chr7g0270611 [Medicago truncatula]
MIPSSTVDSFRGHYSIKSCLSSNSVQKYDSFDYICTVKCGCMSAFGGVSDCCSKTMGSRNSVRFIYYLAKNWDMGPDCRHSCRKKLCLSCVLLKISSIHSFIILETIGICKVAARNLFSGVKSFVCDSVWLSLIFVVCWSTTLSSKSKHIHQIFLSYLFVGLGGGE